MNTKIKILSLLLVALLALPGCSSCSSVVNTDPDWEPSFSSGDNEYTFNSLKEMEAYLIDGTLPTGNQTKLHRVFPQSLAGTGYIPLAELLEKCDGIVSAKTQNNMLEYIDIDCVMINDVQDFSVYGFWYQYDFDGATLSVGRNISLWMRSSSKYFESISSNEVTFTPYNGFDLENGTLLRKCGDTEVVYSIHQGKITGFFLVTGDRLIKINIGAKSSAINTENSAIAPLFSEDDAVFEKAVKRIVDAVNKHSASSKEDVSIGMTKEAFLKTVHGGQYSIENQSFFYAGEGMAVVVTFNDQNKIEKIVEVSLPDQYPSKETMQTIVKGDDPATVLSVTGISSMWEFGGIYAKDCLVFNTEESELYYVFFDENGLVEGVCSNTELLH